MKIKMKKVLPVLAALALVFSLAACGSGADSQSTAESTSAPPIPSAVSAGPLVGDWAIESIGYSGIDLTLGQLEAMLGIAGDQIASVAGLDMSGDELNEMYEEYSNTTLHFEADGTGELQFTEDGQPQISPFTWDGSGSTYTLHDESGQDSNLTYDEEESLLTFEHEGVTLTLKRA